MLGIRVVIGALIAVVAMYLVAILSFRSFVGRLGRGMAAAGRFDAAARPAPPGSQVLWDGEVVASITQISGVQSKERGDSLMMYLASLPASGSARGVLSDTSILAVIEPVTDWRLPVTMRLQAKSAHDSLVRHGLLVFDPPLGRGIPVFVSRARGSAGPATADDGPPRSR